MLTIRIVTIIAKPVFMVKAFEPGAKTSKANTGVKCERKKDDAAEIPKIIDVPNA